MSTKTIYTYNVSVYNKENKVINNLPDLSMNEIEKLKRSFKNGESVRYSLVGFKRANGKIEPLGRGIDPIQTQEDPKTQIIEEPEEEKPSLKELRRKRDNLSMRIRDWKKKGKDEKKIEEMEKQLAGLKKNIKNFKILV